MPDLSFKYWSIWRTVHLCWQFVTNQATPLPLPSPTKLSMLCEINTFPGGSITIQNIRESRVKVRRNAFLISDRCSRSRVLNAFKAKKHRNCAFFHGTWKSDMSEFQLRNKMSFFSGFSHSKCVFLDSVNISLYNDCFWAISWFINGILFSFWILLHARCAFGSLVYLRMARAVFEGTNMVNAKGSNGHFWSWCKDKNFRRTASESLGF